MDTERKYAAFCYIVWLYSSIIIDTNQKCRFHLKAYCFTKHWICDHSFVRSYSFRHFKVVAIPKYVWPVANVLNQCSHTIKYSNESFQTRYKFKILFFVFQLNNVCLWLVVNIVFRALCTVVQWLSQIVFRFDYQND